MSHVSTSALPGRILGASLEVSPIGLGCMGMSGTYGACDDSEAVATIHAAIDHGVTLLDTSDMYGAGHNEVLVGRAIRGHRQQVVVATKFGHLLDASGHPVGVDGSPAYVRQAFEASARRLGVDHVDLYYQHRVDSATPIEDTVAAMATLVAEGKVGAIGLCEAHPSTLRRAHLVHPVAALQSEYSLWWRGVEADILPTCAALGVGFVAYSPLGRGLLTGTLRVPADLPPGDRRRQHPRFQTEHLARNVALVDAIAEVATGIGCSTAQLAVAWLLAQGNHVVPIPGVKSRTHLLANLAALSMTLDGDILNRLDAVAPVGAGSGLRYPESAMKGIEL